MRKSSVQVLLGLSVALLAGLPVQAQVYPKAEVSAGFSVLQPTTRSTYLMTGWQSNMSLNLRKQFAIATDIGAHYRGGSGQGEALIGPQFAARRKDVTAFAHVLVGGMRSWRTSRNSFATALGGGVDIDAGKRVAIRMVQFDYIPNTAGFGSAVRLGLFGVVIKLGQRGPGTR